MAQTLRRGPLAALNSSAINRVHDDKPHTRENTFVAVAFVLAITAIVCAFFDSMHILGAWAGLAGVITALTAQMFSSNTLERFVLIISLGGAAVGLFINMAHGGLW